MQASGDCSLQDLGKVYDSSVASYWLYSHCIFPENRPSLAWMTGNCSGMINLCTGIALLQQIAMSAVTGFAK